MTSRPPKICRVCGRAIQWRRRWARCWDRVRYCGGRCRRTRLDATDHELEDTILGLLACEPVGGTICPSEAARLVAGDTDWRPLLERTRWAAARLAARDRLEIVQNGRPVDPDEARGPARLRLVRGRTAFRPTHRRAA
jgi:hypothetical protein